MRISYWSSDVCSSDLRFRAVDLQLLHARAVHELQRQHSHEHEVCAMDALEIADDHGLAAEQLRALGRPVARRTLAVLVTAEHHRRHVEKGRAPDMERGSSDG